MGEGVKDVVGSPLEVPPGSHSHGFIKADAAVVISDDERFARWDGIEPFHGEPVVFSGQPVTRRGHGGDEGRIHSVDGVPLQRGGQGLPKVIEELSREGGGVEHKGSLLGEFDGVRFPPLLFRQTPMVAN